MIATILPGSADFHAVGYNEHKVYKGVATLLEMQNFGGLEASEHPTAKQLVQFLQFYSSQNSRIQKPQFHVAISCRYWCAKSSNCCSDISCPLQEMATWNWAFCILGFMEEYSMRN